MVEEPQPTEVVLQPNPNWLIAGMLFFGAVGALMAYHGQWFGWLAFGIAVMISLLLFWLVFSPHSRLHLSAEGIRFGSLRRVSTYRWSDIARFFPLRLAGHDLVGFTFSHQFDGETRLRRMNQRFGGFDRFLPSDYGMRAEVLAELLESQIC